MDPGPRISFREYGSDLLTNSNFGFSVKDIKLFRFFFVIDELIIHKKAHRYRTAVRYKIVDASVNDPFHLDPDPRIRFRYNGSDSGSGSESGSDLNSKKYKFFFFVISV